MSDTGLMACGAMIHALRGNTDALHLILDSLTPDELRTVTFHGMSGLAEAVRAVDATHTAEQIALGIQTHAYQQKGNTP
ncbi:hypothetical protein ACH4OT_18670 [Streptomyces murinus]|uniref:hypothetical protein n=1 Tax=Streptomyces murinus TaxID=33900 RepID=UPI0037B361D4